MISRAKKVSSFRFATVFANLLLLQALFFPVALRAAESPQDYLIDVWTSENGLPDSSVAAVAQTPDGFLWVGTYNGIARFDGVHFVMFDPSTTPELVHARVRGLYLDQRGTLWINTYDGSLTTYRNGQFVLERRNPRTSEGEMVLVFSSSNHVMFVTSRGDLLRKNLSTPAGEGWEEFSPTDRRGGALCAEDGDGTVWYRDNNKRLWKWRDEKFSPTPDTAAPIDPIVNCLTTDARGRLWVGTERGIVFWNGKEFQPATPTNVPTPFDVAAISIAPNGNVWAVANGSICVISNRQWVIAPNAMPSLFPPDAGRIGMCEDRREGMWLYNYGHGLIHVSASGAVRRFTQADGFPGERVAAFLEDREGNWWAGLDASGLVRLREAQFHDLASTDASLAKAARSLCEDANGTMWIGFLSGGLLAWQDGSIAKQTEPERTLGSVFCICPDAAGRLWVSAGNEDLFVGKDGNFERVSPLIHGVKSLLADDKGRIWAGTTSGLFVSTNGNPQGFELVQGVPRSNVRALAEDKTGTIWAGTGNGDLFQIAGAMPTAFRPEDHLESGAIWSVLADDDGTIWVGTFRGGLLRFRDGKFTRYLKKDGMLDNVISQILDDGEGNLWLGSHHGVFRVAKSALEDFAAGKSKFVSRVAYGRSDGLPSVECSGGYQPSAWRDDRGRLWFSTAKGATWIQPADIRPNLKPPLVAIEQILIDGRTQPLPANGSNMIRKLTVPPGIHQIEFRYTGLSLAAPEGVQFSYRLEGLDNDWVQAGTRRNVQYGFLAPRDYRFHVIACNSDGVWNSTGSAIAFEVLPHLYETWWFRTVAIVVILGSFAGFVRYAATRRLHRQMELLERRQAVERERARIAKDIHDDLGANLTLIAVLGDLAQKEKTGERVGKMSTTARDALKSLDEIVWAVNPRNDTLSHLVDYTGQFATSYLRDASVRCLLDVPDQLPAQEVPANVRHNVFLVIKEALQNIVKHARATEVWLRINTAEGKLRISIEDNGCGFDGPPRDAWADGLENMRQRLTEVGGICRIESRKGAGTTISMELPLPGANGD